MAQGPCEQNALPLAVADGGKRRIGNLSVGYHGKSLIEDVSLCVQRGKIVTLIGPNGSGKSTILKTVIGQLPELSGT